jgi:large subunit ribosomal protein L13
VSNILQGKHKPTYDPSANCGDHVVIVNAEKVEFTGNKERDKLYIHHTG